VGWHWPGRLDGLGPPEVWGLVPVITVFPSSPATRTTRFYCVFFLVPVDTVKVYGDVPPVIFRGGRIGVYTSLFYWSKYIVILLDVLFVFMIGRYYVFLYWQYNASIFCCH